METTDLPTIIVLGDIMLDVQIHGNIEKMANEAPIPVLHSVNETKQLGGCGNVLMNLQSLGCSRLFLFSMIGNDTSGKEIQEILGKHPEITANLSIADEYCTTVKTRGFSNKKIIFRYDVEKKRSLLERHTDHCKKAIDKILTENKVDSIILSDYNKGFLIKELTQYVIEKANLLAIPTFVDPKVDYTRYIGCTVFKPNIKELDDIFEIKYNFSQLRSIHESIMYKVGCKETVLTLSENGISYLTDLNELLHKKTDSTEVCDVTGAGDVVLSILAYYYNSIEKGTLIHLATWMGTHSVKHVGTYIMKKSDILYAYRYLKGTKIISAKSLIELDVPTVVTNGCFDIVHEGHIALFKYCKSIVPENGSVVIALNGDDSIRRLKGSTRPINSLESRIALLNQIECIDWIVVFEDDTPRELYKELHPTILVKGGDYTVENIVGREYCGDVKIFNYIPGKSTTSIIEKIQELK
jgi:D-beta-D-heptose 7-phosphate kinase / D-beta-D-heptose 1-phosphate adenosyltransferase